MTYDALPRSPELRIVLGEYLAASAPFGGRRFVRGDSERSVVACRASSERVAEKEGRIETLLPGMAPLSLYSRKYSGRRSRAKGSFLGTHTRGHPPCCLYILVGRKSPGPSLLPLLIRRPIIRNVSSRGTKILKSIPNWIPLDGQGRSPGEPRRQGH